MSTYDICVDREAQPQHKIRRPIPRHPRLIPKSSTNSCEHNCQCTHTNNPPAPMLPFQNGVSYHHDLSRGPQQQLAVENHYIVTTSSEHSHMTNAQISCPCECGSSVQGPSSLQSGRSSAVQQMLVASREEMEGRRCHHSKQ